MERDRAERCRSANEARTRMIRFITGGSRGGIGRGDRVGNSGCGPDGFIYATCLSCASTQTRSRGTAISTRPIVEVRPATTVGAAGLSESSFAKLRHSFPGAGHWLHTRSSTSRPPRRALGDHTPPEFLYAGVSDLGAGRLPPISHRQSDESIAPQPPSASELPSTPGLTARGYRTNG